MGTLSVRVLGVIDVEGVDLRQLGSRKARALLRLLALARGRVVSTPQIVDALWAGSPPVRPTDQVAVLASRLRRVLGRERVEHADDGYRLRYDWLDADELAALVVEIDRRSVLGSISGAVAAARVALSLVRADVPVHDEDPEWVRDEIADVQRLIRRGRRLAATALLDAGSWLEAADLVEGDLRRDPFDEDGARLLMRANVAGGRPATALTAYAVLRERLADELGADPAPETEALHLAILRGDVTTPLVEAVQPALVGRGAQLAHLDALVARAASGNVRVAEVVGEPGIGKTTLLRAWGARRAAEGDVVLAGTCGSLDRAIPLDVLLGAIASHLREAGEVAATDLLADDATVLAPLLGLDGSSSAQAAASTLTEGAWGPLALYAALASVLQRISRRATVVLTIDDAHLAGHALTEWLHYVPRRSMPLLVVLARRLGEGEPLPANDLVELGPLDRAAAAELVGAGRIDQLYERSLGHPLFLSELAAAPAGELPGSLVAAIARRCDQLGTAGPLVSAAAVIGPPIDLDLLAAVLRLPVVEVLEGIELATRQGLMLEDAGAFTFRHDLVRDALAAAAPAGRRALLHREAGRVLEARPDADPIRVAEHARRGGDLVLAARSLRSAAARAAGRFDHTTAEHLLDESLALNAETATRLARARVRTVRGNYAAALEDVDAAHEAGAAALEVGAWAAYFGRDFELASRLARDGQVTATDPAVRARCLVVGGRVHHAQGDLTTARELLTEAIGSASGADRAAASAWLGVLLCHQSRTSEALDLLSPATGGHVDSEGTSATLHATLFTGYAHALAGRPARALTEFDRYTSEVERRHVPRFSGRGINFEGWVRRNLGDRNRAVEAHQRALEVADEDGTDEVRIAALEDLAEDRIVAGDPDGARAHLDEAARWVRGDLVFGWRLAMKLSSLRARLALQTGEPEEALGVALRLGTEASSLDVPRYAAVAALLAHRAHHALGRPPDPGLVERDLRQVQATAAIEGWWWAGETGAGLGVEAWVDLAESLVAGLAERAGPDGDVLRRHAERRLAEWRVRTR